MERKKGGRGVEGEGTENQITRLVGLKESEEQPDINIGGERAS